MATMPPKTSEKDREPKEEPKEEPPSGFQLNGFDRTYSFLALLGMMYMGRNAESLQDRVPTLFSTWSDEGFNGFGNLPHLDFDLKVPELFAATPFAATPENQLTCRLVLFVVISSLCFAIHFSLSVPRPTSTRRWRDVGVQLLLFLGDMVLMPYYILRPSTPCELTYDGSSEANRRLIQQVPLLRDYHITPWLRNHWMALGRVSIKELLSFTCDKAKYLSIVNREVISLPEGGQVALDWYPGGEDMPASAPVLYIAPTLMGDGRSYSTKEIADYFTANGWRCVCFVKRGGGYFDPLPLTDWVPTDPLSFEDTLMGLKVVRERYPESFLGIAGLSAGGGWVRRYCAAVAAGLAPDYTDVAMCMDGGFNWLTTMIVVCANAPVIARVMSAGMARPLLVKATQETPPAWLNVKRIVASIQVSWLSFMDNCHRAAAGLTRTEEYFENFCDKTKDLKQQSNIPLLIHSSYADGCSPADYWLKTDPVAELPSNCSNTFVCLSTQGAHCCRPTGWSGNGNWAAMSTLEFFQAVAARGKTSKQ